MPDPPDPAEVLALLWGASATDPAPRRGPRRGPRRALDVAAVVAAATTRADAAGPSGAQTLTMRTLAADLGVGAMTLYTYVPGREALRDLMLDAAYAAMPRTDTTGAPWRARLTAVAEENRALHHAHPWTVRADPTRPTLGPGETAKYEHELAAFDDTGLGDVDRDAALTFLLDVVRAASRVELEAATDDMAAWWAARAPTLGRVLEPGRYPRATRVGAAAGEAVGGVREAERVWRFGLARAMDGLATLVGAART